MKKEKQKSLDPAAIRARFAGVKGKAYWRSLEELAGTKEFERFLEDEFPHRASLLEIDRRQFLTVMGASLALAGLTGCRQLPQAQLVPYVRAPEELVPGKPLLFATAFTLGGYALGVLAKSYDGRPIKIEGNPDHPASRGSTDTFAQASLLTLYDPDRSQSVTNDGEISAWETFLATARQALEQQRATKGAGLRILTETITSPTLADQLTSLLKRFPEAKWHQYEPAGRDSVRAGARAAFGEYVNTVYRFDRADVILSLDSDFLLSMPGHVRYARDFMDRRRVRAKQTGMNRLYVAESTPTNTGAMADHRLPLRPSEVESLARAVASRVGAPGTPPGVPAPDGVPAKWLSALVRDLQANRGKCLIVPGEQQSPAVHALAHAMNQALGNVGKTVVYTAPVEVHPMDQTASLRELVDEMQKGHVKMLVVLGGNPAYDAPADIPFAEALIARADDKDKVPLRVRLGMYEDETSALCSWHIPETHYLEAWSDARAYEGTISIIQPLIAPLYDGKSAHELLAEFLDEARPGYDIVRAYWSRQHPGADFEPWWEKVLRNGVVPGTALPAKTVALKANLASMPAAPIAPAPDAHGLEISFRPDPTLWDGRFANNGWLQELPKPITKLTWDNAAFVSAATAKSLGIVPTRGDSDGNSDLDHVADYSRNQVVELSYQERTLRVPVWILPGQPDNTVTLTLGYGRTRAGRVGNGTGFNAYALRTAAAPWFGSGLQVTKKTGDYYELVSTQGHHLIESDRNVVHTASIGDFIARKGKVGQEEVNTPSPEAPRQEVAVNGDVAHGQTVPADWHRRNWDYLKNQEGSPNGQPSMYPEFDYQDNYAWGMSIDLNACIGCNVCTIACQAENNIPTVGKEQVSRGRAMHWIRIDHYYRGNVDNPENYFQPVPCMHCEKAPCEPVCPVAATVHSHEGLNQMVYNRCVGTRYCSNNCPYKVRRFNFLNYANHHEIPVLKMLNNPDVTVRGRGVMEKCTYCVQRINAARIEAKKEGRPIGDGEVMTACAQACPTEAIFFGNINDPKSRIRKVKAEPHDYVMLEDLDTRPRTSYLARLRNPNPEIETA